MKVENAGFVSKTKYKSMCCERKKLHEGDTQQKSVLISLRSKDSQPKRKNGPGFNSQTDFEPDLPDNYTSAHAQVVFP